VLPLLLLITSDRTGSQPLRHEISASGFKAYCVETLTSALGVMAQWRFDAVLLQAEGFEGSLADMLSSLRRGDGMPILLVDPGADEDQQVQALEAGASQVVVDVTSTRVLAAQLRRLIDVAHPRQQQESSEVRFGPLRLDPRRARASVGDVPVALTRGEFEVLLLLASQPGELVHRQTIARTLGRAEGADTRRSADMHICRIRRKLRDAGGTGLLVETVYGRGYLLRLRSEGVEREDGRVAEWFV
jgi:DNA-binding response OmpR family regulator